MPFMKKYLFIVTIAVLSVAACKKDTPVAVAGFTTSHSGYYLTQSVSFTNTSTNAKTYSWDFGDNATSTVQSPTHTYTQPGNYTIRLITDGTSLATKMLKIYDGTASYQVQNQTGISLDMVSFAADADQNVIDFIDNGTIATNSTADTVYTNDLAIYVGGTLPNDSTFVTATPFTMQQFSNNVLTIDGTTQVYIENIPTKKSTTQSFHLSATAPKKNMSSIVSAKHTVQ